MLLKNSERERVKCPGHVFYSTNSDLVNLNLIGSFNIKIYEKLGCNIRIFYFYNKIGVCG